MNALYYIFNIVSHVLVGVLLVRFLLQVVRADFHNPVSQGILKLTNPIVMPLRRVIPAIKGMDMASLVAALLMQLLFTFLVSLLFTSRTLPLLSMLMSATISFIDLVLNLYLMLIFIRVILSWVGTDLRNPVISIIYSLTEPVLAPARRIVPMLGNLDISPILVIIVIGALRELLTKDLARLFVG